MNTLYFIAASSMPLVIATIAALISEYAGRMIFFIDGLITISAFICYAISVSTSSLFLGIICAIIIPAVFIFCIALVMERFNFNYFIVSLGQNVFLLSCVSALSVLVFHNRGVLFSEGFEYSQVVFRAASFAAGVIVIFTSLFFLTKTKKGLYLRITGTDAAVLKNNGVRPENYRIGAWVISSVLSSVSGILLLLRLSSFVPGISSGIGWASLAIVFLGRRKPVLSVIMAFVFGVAQFFANNIQNIEMFKNIPSAVLLALPYLISIVLILVIPDNKRN